MKSTFLLIAVTLALTACSKGYNSSTSNSVTYTIGGTVTNLAGMGGGLQLQDNGTDALLVNANGSFTFATALASGAAYNVTVFRQPSSPAQTCAVTQGGGKATANVTSVVVDCGHNEWTWMGGSNIANQKGLYGTLGTPAANNTPGGRAHPATWTDAAGNFWLFGGFGHDSAGTVGELSDLWKYNAGQWTWMGGSNVVNQKGTYGTLGTPAATNIPGARESTVSWTDAAGNFWLFGGFGYDSTGTTGELNDLWKYNAGQWTWMGGSNVVNQKGMYGSLGMSAAGNIPGGRSSAMAWTDAAGNFWLFGGSGFDSAGTGGQLNDLWKYSAGQWTWMGGSNVVNQPGTYGTLGTAAATNVPVARYGSAARTDPAGNVWLFGGVDPTGNNFFNDLWKYSGGQWTWMGGSNVVNQPGTYGAQGTPAPGNVPGARRYSVTWTDAAGNVWFFGGGGYDSTGTFGQLNDLWKYEP